MSLVSEPITMTPHQQRAASKEPAALVVSPPEEPEAEPSDPRQPGLLEGQLTRREQVTMYIVVWCMVFVLGFSKSIFGVLTPYVTSSFDRHALTATTSVLANIASGVIVLPYARLIETWGRPESLSLMVALTTIGSAMMAACQNVKTYCAAQVFYYVGYYGIQFSLVILIADISPYKDRALLFGIIWSPSLCSLWAYGPTAQSILNTIGLAWGFGVWTIAIPVFCAPLVFLMFRHYASVKKANHCEPQRSHQTYTASIVYWIREFDMIGLLILATGLSTLLLALSIYSYQSRGWESPLILSFVILGPLLLVGFALYEKYVAPTTFLPARILADRTVVWTMIMAATLYTSEFVNSAYVYSMMIVVFNQNVTQATYINNIYSIGSSFTTIVFGIALKYYGRVKWYTFLVGIPSFILGQGLMIAFRQSFTPVSLLVICQILISIGGGIIYPVEQMVLMDVSREHTTALLAVESVVVYAAKAAGSAIATAIWTDMFKKKLEHYLPSSELLNVDKIYGSLDVQSSYAIGSESRLAIQHAYLDTQRVIFIVAAAILSVTWISVLFWRDVGRVRGSPTVS